LPNADQFSKSLLPLDSAVNLLRSLLKA